MQTPEVAFTSVPCPYKHPDLLPVVCRYRLDRLLFWFFFICVPCSPYADGREKKGPVVWTLFPELTQEELGPQRVAVAVAVAVVPLAFCPALTCRPTKQEREGRLYRLHMAT